MSKYFNDSEVSCKCCGQLPAGGMNGTQMELLDLIRERLGKPVYVTSGYRCYSNNLACGGSRNSQHLFGLACDLTYDNINVNYFAQLISDCMDELGIEGGIGKYWSQEFVHVDTRNYTARWTEND